MKINSNRIGALLMIVIALLLGAWRIGITQAQQNKAPSAKTIYQQALHEEEAAGNLKAAITLYERVLSAKPDRALAAQTLIRMADCHQKLGDGRSNTIYEQVVRDYTDQKEAVATAKAKLRTTATSDKLIARQILTGPTVNGTFDVTADGHFMAQTDYETTGDVLIRDLSTGLTRRLMAKTQTLQQNEEFAENPLFSPNAREIAFAWFTGSGYQLRIMRDEVGAKARVLVANDEFNYVSPSGWSRDGEALLAMFWKRDNTAQLTWVTLKDGSMRSLKSLEWRQPSERPSISPDGQYIAYSARERSDIDKRNVYLVAADGRSETTLVSGSAINDDPVWTADGTHVLFISDRAGNLGLWAVAIREGKPAGEPFLVKPNLGAQAYAIGFTRAGAYYYMTRRGGEDVFLADVARETGNIVGSPIRATEKFVGSNLSPSWSPDGKSIAFKRSGSWAFDLVVHSLQTAQERSYAIPFRTRPVPRPLWFPDGASLLVDIIDNQGRNGYYRADLETGKFLEVVRPAKGLMQWAALSPDGQSIYVVVRREGDNDSIITFDVATGQEKSAIAHQGSITSLAISPDGHTLLMRKSVRRGQQSESYLALVGINGSNYRELPEAGNRIPGPTGGLAWSKDGRSIFYVSADTPARVMTIPVDGGKPSFTGLTIRSRAAFTHFIDFNPDGSRIAFGQGEGATKEVWALENVLSKSNTK